MSWTYSDYITLDEGTAAWKTQLRLHIQEVSNRIDTIISSDGQSEDPGPLQEYLSGLKAELKPWNASAAVSLRTVMGRVRR